MPIRMILTGGRAGYTGLLGKFKCVDGVITIPDGDEKAVFGNCRYLGRVYQAFPEGSEELRNHVNGALPAAAGPAESVHGGDPAGEHGAAQESADDGSRAGDPKAGAAGSAPTAGDRYANARLDRIREAVMALSSENDDHWTADGLPLVDVIASMVGDPSVKRKDVERAVPGLTRKK